MFDLRAVVHPTSPISLHSLPLFCSLFVTLFTSPSLHLSPPSPPAIDLPSILDHLHAVVPLWTSTAWAPCRRIACSPVNPYVAYFFPLHAPAIPMLAGQRASLILPGSQSRPVVAAPLRALRSPHCCRPSSPSSSSPPLSSSYSSSSSASSTASMAPARFSSLWIKMSVLPNKPLASSASARSSLRSPTNSCSVVPPSITTCGCASSR